MATYTIKALDPIKPEGDVGLTEFRFSVTRAGPFDPDAEFERVHLKLDTPEIDGFDGFSFSPADGRIFGRDNSRLGIVFDPGETEQIITVSIRADLLVENDELIRLTLSSYGEINATEGSVNARGIDGSDQSIALNDDDEAEHAAEQFHTDLILRDGLIDPFEQDFILNPPDGGLLLQQLIDWILRDLFASSQDGEFDEGEIAALDAIYLGKGFDEDYIALRDAEIEAAASFDPPPDIALLDEFEVSGLFEGMATAPDPAALLDAIYLAGGEVDIDPLGLVIAGGMVPLDLAFTDVEATAVAGGPDILQLSNGNSLYVDAQGILFLDGELRFDVDRGENAGTGYRIYQAAFDRTPDPLGLAFWIDQLDDSTSLHDIADAFIGSAEFAEIYGSSPTNEEFVSRLYQNVLGREGEAAGVDFWNTLLLSGGADRATVLSSFSESAENVVGVAPDISNGIFLG